MFAASIRTNALPGPALGVGMVLTSGGCDVEVSTRARWVAGIVVISGIGEFSASII